MHDGIELEIRGVPAAVVCTEPFVSMGRATAHNRGIPNYPFVALPHPMARLDASGLEERVMQSLGSIEALLLRGTAEP